MNMLTRTELQQVLITAVNPIDELVLLDKEVKALEKRVKALKEQVANEMGEGEHSGELYSCTVKLVPTTRVDWKAIAEECGIPEAVIAKHTSRDASIRVCPKA